MPLDDFDFVTTSRFRRNFGHISSQSFQLISHKLGSNHGFFAHFWPVLR